MNVKGGAGDNSVVFYDGDCGMCNAAVLRILDWDTAKQLWFAPLQGEYAKTVLPEVYTKELSTMVLRHEGEMYVKSAAMLKILKLVQRYVFLSSVCSLIPRFLRDLVYTLVAKNRSKLSSKMACRLPSAEEQSRFLQ